MNFLQYGQYLWNIVFSRRSVGVLLELVPRSTQHFTKIDQNKRKIDYRICYVNIDLRHQYGISVAESQTFLRAKRPQRRRARKNGWFRMLHQTLFYTFRL